MRLSEKKCLPCTGNVQALEESSLPALLAQLPKWQIVDGKRLQRIFRFDNFVKPMRLAKRIAEVSDEQNHHPDLLIRWGELKVDIWTHKINSLTENDFIMAAKIDKCAEVENSHLD